uniref:Ig-like domain-containing protein n=1 Tax=Anopheles culicifacies TaxID=139723 RepID=A0A182MQK8_9DIPT
MRLKPDNAWMRLAVKAMLAGLLSVLAYSNVDSVHITHLSVPRVHVLDNYHHQRHDQHQYYARSQLKARDDPDIPFDPAEPDPLSLELRAPDPAEHLVLDCEYVIEPHETGFVLKWLHNDVPIYQWIPPHRSPSSLNRMRDHVNRTFTVGNEAMHKHRALALMHPSQDFAGKYSCSVQTFQSFDIKSADLFIIVPEYGFVLKNYQNLNDLVTVICSVYGIFPAPELSLWINDYRLENGTINEIPVAEGLYDSSITVQLVLYESLQPDDVIKCMLTIPGTEYRRTKETVFVVVNNRPFGESNSILDPFGMVSFSSSSSSTAKVPVVPLTSTTSTVPEATTTQDPTPSTKVTVTQQPSSSAVAGTVSSKDTVRPQIPSVIRLRPTASSTRVLTVQQSNTVDSDEIMNVLDFKELLNENLLYNNGATRLESFQADTDHGVRNKTRQISTNNLAYGKMHPTNRGLPQY